MLTMIEMRTKIEELICHEMSLYAKSLKTDYCETRLQIEMAVNLNQWQLY